MIDIAFLWHYRCWRWQHHLLHVAFINFRMPQIPNKYLITSFQKPVYYITLSYHLVCLELWEGLYCFTLITCFTMLPFGQITCFLDVWGILYYFTIFSMWLYYIFILFQIYYMQMLVIIEHFYRVALLLNSICPIYLKNTILLRLSNVFYHIALLLNWISCSYVLEGLYHFVLIIYFTVLNFYQNASFPDL